MQRLEIFVCICLYFIGSALCKHITVRERPIPVKILNSSVKVSGNQRDNINKQTLLKGILIPWLYFMAVNMNVPNMPRLINTIVNNGATKVSGEIQRIYGNLSGLDALFTFLSVNAIGCLSDVYGRKPFMMYSAFGLAIGYLICSRATPTMKWIFYLSGVIDGLTSCMFSQSQAYVSDIGSALNENLSVVLSQFQGLAIGLAFMFGIPFGGLLGTRVGLRAPLYCAAFFCAVCFVSILLFLPESVNITDRKISKSTLQNLNPFGAVGLFLRSRRLIILAAVYILLNIAQAGIQIIWINYLQRVFGWPAEVSAFTLAIVGLTCAVVPRLIIPRIGTRLAIKSGLLTHAASLVLLASTTGQIQLFCTMPLFAIGASTNPTVLGYIAEQVNIIQFSNIIYS
jgi:MFS family permease